MERSQGLGQGIYGYISPQGVQNLDLYKYSGVDESILVKLFMKEFWNWLIDNVVPIWIAPNLLTLIGWFCVFAGYSTLWFYCPDFEGSAPSWAYVATAFFVFAYQTMDNLDGKQARKTKSSSALGEVFDHGADSLTVGMFAMIMGTAFQLGPVLTLTSLLTLMFAFYLAHWECYFTGILLLRPTSNPTEAQFSLISLLLLTAWKGATWWTTPIETYVLGAVEPRYLFVIVSVVGFLFTVYEHMTSVHKHIKEHGGSFKSTLLALVPLTVLGTMAILWACFAPTVLYDHRRLYLSTIALLFAYLQIRLIVQHITKDRFGIFYNALTPLVLITFHSLIGLLFAPLLDDEFILQIYFLCVLLHTGFLVVSIVTELALYLNITVFTIKPVVSEPENMGKSLHTHAT